MDISQGVTPPLSQLAKGGSARVWVPRSPTLTKVTEVRQAGSAKKERLSFLEFAHGLLVEIPGKRDKDQVQLEVVTEGETPAFAHNDDGTVVVEEESGQSDTNQAFETRQAEIAEAENPDLRRFLEFFLWFDLKTHVNSPRSAIAGSASTEEDAEAMLMHFGKLVELLDYRVKVRHAERTRRDRGTYKGPVLRPVTTSRSGRPKAVFVDLVRHLSELQLEILRQHFGPGYPVADLPKLRLAFDLFASGQLRTTRAVGGNAEPDSWYFFLFAEFAFLAVDLDIHKDEWGRLLSVFVPSQQLFMDAYFNENRRRHNRGLALRGVAPQRLRRHYNKKFFRPIPMVSVRVAQLHDQFPLQALAVDDWERHHTRHICQAFTIVSGVPQELFQPGGGKGKA